jgi:hypothetical protein
MLMNKNTLTALTYLVLGAGGPAYAPDAFETPWEGEPSCEPQPNPAQTEPRPPQLTQN